jgi:hypothetical protein
MVEGEDRAHVQELAEDIAREVRASSGATMQTTR